MMSDGMGYRLFRDWLRGWFRLYPDTLYRARIGRRKTERRL